jgi:hypothetical protein
MRDMEDVVGQPGRTIVCPWHLYDFDLRDGSSSTGMSVCVYTVEIRTTKESSSSGLHEWDVYVEEPEVEGRRADEEILVGNQWEVVEVRGVSEDFADPPPAPSTSIQEQNDGKDSKTAPGMLSSITSALSRTLNINSESTTPAEEIDQELSTKTLLSSALLILQTSSAPEKIRRTRQTLQALRTGRFKSLKPSQKDVSAAKALFEPLSPEEEAERISRGEDVKQGRTVEGFVPPRGDTIKTVDVWNVKSRGKGGNEKSRILMLRTHATRYHRVPLIDNSYLRCTGQHRAVGHRSGVREQFFCPLIMTDMTYVPQMGHHGALRRFRDQWRAVACRIFPGLGKGELNGRSDASERLC